MIIFNKCIHINNNWLITIDDQNIYLWYKNNLNYFQFLNIINKIFEDKIYDICQINDKHLLISQNLKLTFFTFESLKEDKIIRNMDCADKLSSLLIINGFILVNCINGIAIILIKTKEMIQYINWPLKNALKLYRNQICIFGMDTTIYKCNLLEYKLILLSKIHINGKGFTYDIYIKEEEAFIWGNALFKLIKEK